MKILRNYILKEMLTSLAVLLCLFTFVLVMGNVIKLADLIINKGVDVFLAVKLFVYLMPYLLMFSIPMAMLTATLLVFGRLSSDNEMLAMRTSGISLLTIFMPVITLAVIFSLATIHLNDQVLPKTHFAARKILKNMLIKKPTAYLDAGTFIKEFENYIIFIYEIDKNVLKNIRIYEPQEGKPTRTIVASRGEFVGLEGTNSIRIKLTDGTSDEPNPTSPLNFYKLNFKTYYITLNLDQLSEKGKLEKKLKEMSIKELQAELVKLKKKKVDINPVATEIHKRIVMGLSNLVFVLIALPLAITIRRGEKTIGFGISLALIVAYWLLLAGAEACASRGILTPAICMWTPTVSLSLLGVVMIIFKSVR